MALRFRFVVEGPAPGWDKQILADVAKANTEGMRRAVDGAKGDIRRAIQAAGLGRRLGFTIGAQVYPKAGASLTPAGELRSRGQSAEKILRSYMQGTTIKARSANAWLAIPIKENLPVLARGEKPTPELVERRLGVALRWVVPRGGRVGFLYADALTRGNKNGRLKRLNPRAKKQRANSTLVGSLAMFVLVKQVQVRKRLDFTVIGQRWAGQLPRLLAASLRKT